MFDKWRRYSYAAQKNQRSKLRWFLFVFLALYVLYNSLTSFFFSMRVLKNDTMRPGLRAGDRLVFSSFSVQRFLSDVNITGKSLPFERGSIVLVDLSLREKRNVFVPVLDGFVRFFTAQQLSLTGEEEQYLKRVIGLPGDEVVMTNYILHVKPADSSYRLTEFELSDKPYDVEIPQVPALWDESIPFSGSMDRLVLGDNECFVLADDRSNTNDSRTWGPVELNLVTGKALFRYWPFMRLGRP
ncbi:MAG: signal peptidase I [Treponema sp.]|jgi:signal peptidase I|nr:signal peptidase I [Treponema sp.]